MVEYNKHMGIVDQCDMQLSFTESTRKTMKWYKKLFIHLLDLAVYNSYILYKESRNVEMELSTFQLHLIKELCERGPQEKHYHDRPGQERPGRLTERHFPSLITNGRRRKCHICSNTRKKPRNNNQKTYYECVECNVGLCVSPCFKEYHTLMHF